MHLKISAHNGIAFSWRWNSNIWQCCFCTKLEWILVVLSALNIYQDKQPLLLLFFFFFFFFLTQSGAAGFGGVSNYELQPAGLTASLCALAIQIAAPANQEAYYIANQHSACHLSEISSCLLNVNDRMKLVVALYRDVRERRLMQNKLAVRFLSGHEWQSAAWGESVLEGLTWLQLMLKTAMCVE